MVGVPSGLGLGQGAGCLSQGLARKDAGDALEALVGQGADRVKQGTDLLGAQSPAFGTEDVGCIESELGRLLLLALRASYTCSMHCYCGS